MKTQKSINVFFSFLIVMLLSVSFSNAYAQDSKEQEKEEKKEEKLEKKRKEFQKNKNLALKEMYKAYPDSKAQMAKSYGYAAFANLGVNLFVLASGNGGGMAHNNSTGAELYVKMISYGAGVGIGLKKYYAVFLFENKAAYDNFLKSGWSADGQADATADSGKEGQGGSVAAGMSISPGVTLYQIADKGLAIQATAQGVKYIVSDELNSN